MKHWPQGTLCMPRNNCRRDDRSQGHKFGSSKCCNQHCKRRYTPYLLRLLGCFKTAERLGTLGQGDSHKAVSTLIDSPFTAQMYSTLEAGRHSLCHFARVENVVTSRVPFLRGFRLMGHPVARCRDSHGPLAGLKENPRATQARHLPTS